MTLDSKPTASTAIPAAAIPFQARILTYVPAIGIMTVIFFASSLSGDEVQLPDFALSDKLAHFCIYSLLGMSLALRPRWMKAWWSIATPPLQPWNWLLGWAFALSDEVHQIFVPGRQAGWEDWVADALGVGFGWWVFRRKGRTATENA
jgi:VanZ like family